MEYVLLHFDHFKQARWIGLLQFLVTFQDFSQSRIGPRSTLGLEREQIWSLSREKSTLLFPTVSSSQLSFPPLLRKQKGERLGVLSELLAAAGSLELAGWALAWKWWVPDSRRPFRKEKTRKTQRITKITQRSQVWNGTSASSFTEGMQQGRMRREGEGAWCWTSRWNGGKTTGFLAHSPYKKATAEASPGRIGAFGILCFIGLFSVIKKITSAYTPHPAFMVVQKG